MATDFDALLMSPQLLDDPYAVYAQLREESPVYRSEALGQWLVTRHDDVMRLLHEPAVFSNFGWDLARLLRLPPEVRARCGLLESMLRTPVVVFSDPPEHTRLRKLVVRTFTPRGVESSRDWVGELCDDLLDGVHGSEHVDLVEHLAFPLPIGVIAQLFGARREDVGIYKAVSKARLLFQGTPVPQPELAEALNHQLTDFKPYLEGLFERLRADPDGGLLSTLLQPSAAGDRLDPDELFHTCVVFLSAGHETTTALLSNLVLALLRHPDQLELVRRDRSKVPAAVEEALRWVTPVQRVLRVAREDVELGGRRIRAGDVVVAVLGAANRDPAVFPDPDRFDVERDGAGHVAFGHGIHFCVGAGLGRLEAAIALGRLLDRVEAIELNDAQPPRWAGSISIRALDALPVRVRWRGV